MSSSGFRLLVGELVTGLEMPRLTFHQLPHAGDLLLSEGVPVQIVAKRPGHKDASVTLSVYADGGPDDEDRAVPSFSKAVWGA
jgi:integrase